MFKRPRHNIVARILAALDEEALLASECYFGGGTAIVLELGEYRESADIDFLCASQSGYRGLRQWVVGGTLARLFKPGTSVTTLRNLTSDQYGIRTQLAMEGTPIKFEIIREARITLSGAVDPTLTIPLLSRSDMYAEKLLANADRYADRGVLSRDIIDLSMMISRWGPIPETAWAKARDAYGTTVDTAYGRAVQIISDTRWLESCMAKMAMDADLGAEILSQHERSL